MNTDPKVLLTITLEGGILKRGEPKVEKYTLRKKDLFPNQKFDNSVGKNILQTGTYTYRPLIPTYAKQKITLCKDAYDYMTSTEIPFWFLSGKPQKERIKVWRKMSPKDRLETHLARTCLHFKGLSFTYQIINE